MTKLEFMKELESLLLDIPLEEREEALKYYNGYFEDAGEDHEAEIIAELGSPKQVADIIKADLNLNAGERGAKGYFTEKGYQEDLHREKQYELVGAGQAASDSSGSREQAEGTRDTRYRSWNNGNGEHSGNNGNNGNSGNANQGGYSSGDQSRQDTRSKNTNIALIILLCIFAIPVGIPLVCTILGVTIGIVAAVIGLIFGFGAAGIGLICAGVALVVAGLIQMSMPLIGFAFVGGGLIVFGIGMLLTMACVGLCRTVLPAIIKGFVNLCRMPFKNRSVMA